MQVAPKHIYMVFETSFLMITSCYILVAHLMHISYKMTVQRMIGLYYTTIFLRKEVTHGLLLHFLPCNSLFPWVFSTKHLEHTYFYYLIPSKSTTRVWPRQAKLIIVQSTCIRFAKYLQCNYNNHGNIPPSLTYNE